MMMNWSWKLGRVANSLLSKFGCRLVSVDPVSGRTFSEHLLNEALTELDTVYSHALFHEESHADTESLRILSGSMYTKFSTGLFLIRYLSRSLDREGDVCEFGVGQGVISALIAHGIQKTDRNIWLFDIFDTFRKTATVSFPPADPPDRGSVRSYRGELSFSETMVRTRLDEIGFPRNRTRIVAGFIEETLQGTMLPDNVCFAYVDCNYYEPTRASLEFLDRVLQPGGVVIVDDYDFRFQGVKRAVDEFFEHRSDRYAIDRPDAIRKTFCILSRKK